MVAKLTRSRVVSLNQEGQALKVEPLRQEVWEGEHIKEAQRAQRLRLHHMPAERGAPMTLPPLSSPFDETSRSWLTTSIERSIAAWMKCLATNPAK